MIALLDTPLVLLAVALCLRLLPLRLERDEPWRTPVELGLAFALGLLTAVVKAWWLAPYLMADGTDTSDISDICRTVEAMLNLEISNVQRQPVAALLPTLLSYPLGFFDGVAAGALASTAALGAALFLWARILHSRLAGIAAALFSCAFSCYTVMPRYLTFYPECIAAYAICAAATAAAIRWRNLTTLALTGASIGLALGVDHTGLLYAAVPLAVAGVVAMSVPLRRIPLRLAVLMLPILLSWGGTRLITPRDMPSLEDKATLFTADNVGHPVSRPKHSGYNWGHSGPLGITRALVTLASLAREEPNPEAPRIKDRHRALPRTRAVQVIPWIPVALVALVLTGLALRRRPREVLGLVVMLVPFAVLLRTVANTQVLPKYLMGPMLPVPVLMGVAWAVLAHRWSEQPQSWLPRVAVPALTVVLLGLMVTGVMPSWLGPGASRRERMATDPGFYEVYTHNPEDLSDRRKSCFRLFEYDQRRGVPAQSRIYSRAWFKQRWQEIRSSRPRRALPPAVRPPAGRPHP